MSADNIEKIFAFILGSMCGVFVGWLTLDSFVGDRYRQLTVKENVAYYTNDINGNVVFKFKSHCE